MENGRKEVVCDLQTRTPSSESTIPGCGRISLSFSIKISSVYIREFYDYVALRGNVGIHRKNLHNGRTAAFYTGAFYSHLSELLIF